MGPEDMDVHPSTAIDTGYVVSVTFQTAPLLTLRRQSRKRRADNELEPESKEGIGFVGVERKRRRLSSGLANTRIQLKALEGEDQRQCKESKYFIGRRSATGIHPTTHSPSGLSFIDPWSSPPRKGRVEESISPLQRLDTLGEGSPIREDQGTGDPHCSLRVESSSDVDLRYPAESFA
jgi:hypothetical protein